MKKFKAIDNMYIPEDPLQYLDNFEIQTSDREVLFTIGAEQVLKDSGKYYIESTIYPSKNKEISREQATEIWQSHNMKPRSDVSINFDFM